MCHFVVRVFVPSKKKRVKQRRVVATKPKLQCKDHYTPTPQQPRLGKLLTLNYQNLSFPSSSSEPTVDTSHQIFPPPNTRDSDSQGWSSFVEDNDAMNALLVDLFDSVLDNKVPDSDDEEYRVTTNVNLDPGGPLESLVNSVNTDSFAGRQFFGTVLSAPTLVRTSSEQSMASCGSTASSILGSIPILQGNNKVDVYTNQHSAIPHDITGTCGNVFSNVSLENQEITWTRETEQSSQSTAMLHHMNPRDMPSELMPPLHRDSPASPMFSCFSTVEQRVLNDEDATTRFAPPKQPVEDWPALTTAGESLSHLPVDSTDSSAILTMKNEDLTRSESVFPAKLHRMLQDADREGFHHIVSWVQGGTAFQVHDVESFMRHVMTKYFDQSKFQSFRRQLNLYQFTRVNSTVHGTYYFHKYFLQRDPSLCHQITRPKSIRRSKQT